MSSSYCHFAVFVFLTYLISCRGDDPRIAVGDQIHNQTHSPNPNEAIVATTKVVPNVSTNASSSVKPDAIIATTLKPNVNLTVVPAPTTVKPDIVSSAADPGDITIPTPSTVRPDPDPSTPPTPPPPPPTTPPTTTVPTTSSSTTPTTPPSTTSPTTTAPTTSSTTTTVKPPITTTPKQNVTTAIPVTTAAPAPHHNRQFDGPSFIGGIILAFGLMAIGFVAFKFYKARTERNYHTL